MHSSVALAVASTLTMSVGVFAWIWVKPWSLEPVASEGFSPRIGCRDISAKNPAVPVTPDVPMLFFFSRSPAISVRMLCSLAPRQSDDGL
jgi:hypothetical protein